MCFYWKSKATIFQVKDQHGVVKMRLYSGIIIAFKLMGWFANPVTLLASSRTEAVGKLHELMYETYPISDGYFGHNCEATEVLKEMYYAAYDGYVQ